ncbi:hypothetical protein CcaCcLH18_05027 [Colletotrichum camelliae]|nr:hypothetical protein CcaCcLH18_05027 [Colletotrichum camelliae]
MSTPDELASVSNKTKASITTDGAPDWRGASECYRNAMIYAMKELIRVEKERDDLRAKCAAFEARIDVMEKELCRV